MHCLKEAAIGGQILEDYWYRYQNILVSVSIYKYWYQYDKSISRLVSVGNHICISLLPSTGISISIWLNARWSGKLSQKLQSSFSAAIKTELQNSSQCLSANSGGCLEF